MNRINGELARGINSDRFCEECGYCLTGLAAKAACPECGQRTGRAPGGDGERVAWSRSVAAGLALLVFITMQAVCSVLVQPYEELGGTGPALNLPGPKLWAMPLLQRPIGHSPELPGVVGTRTAMLSMLAIWLITAPCSLHRMQGDQSLRMMTRWISGGLFGIAFGSLLARQGLWPNELPPFRLLLVGGVEFPCAILLYLYLRRLAQHVPGIARRRAFDLLAWLAPLVMFAGAVNLLAQWWTVAQENLNIPARTLLAVNAVYGAAAIVAGVASTSAVAGLAAAYFRIAFPSSPRAIRAGAAMVGRTVKVLREKLTGDRRRCLGIAVGAILLILAMIAGLDQIMWTSTRSGLGGNLPFLNYPGPKVWGSAVIVELGGRYAWEPLVQRGGLLALNLAAVWLMTMPTKQMTGKMRLLMRSARWLPILGMGATFGCLTATRGGAALGLELWESHRSEFFALVTVGCELPATLLLYLVLANLANEFGLPRTARSFRALLAVITLLVVASMLTFAESRTLLTARARIPVLTIAGLFGAAQFGSAAWATASLIALAKGAITRRALAPSPMPVAMLTTIAQEKPPQAVGRFDDALDELDAAITG